MTLQNFSQNKQRSFDNIKYRVALYSVAKKLPIYKISCKVSNAMRYSVRNVAKSFFFDVTKFRSVGLRMVWGQTDYTYFCGKGKIVEQGLGHLLLPQVVFISIIQPISSSISLMI